MAIDKNILTKEWINFLRNNRIVSTQQDPSGKLAYRKQITPDVVLRFCELKTDFDKETINNAIQTVITKKTGISPAGDQEKEQEQSASSTFSRMGTQLGAQSAPTTNEASRPGRAAFSQMGKQLGATPDTPNGPHGATKVSPAKAASGAFSQMGKQLGVTPNASKGTQKTTTKPAPAAFSQMGKQLADTGATGSKEVAFNEKDIEMLFDILAGKDLSSQPAREPSQQQTPQQTRSSGAPHAADKQTNIKRLKRLIRDEMSPEQRKSLWRELNDTALSEAQISPADVNAVFKDAYKLRNASMQGFKGAFNSGLGKINKSLKKDKVDVNDLQQSWKDAGYPDDTRDISKVLKSHGFGESEITKIFSNTFGDMSHDDRNVSSPAIAKIADYVKKHDLQDDLIAFMQQEFGEELGVTTNRGILGKAVDYGKTLFSRKATVEEVREIFTSIVNEERTERHILIRETELKLLGRNRRS